tara:strand:+ start:192 stop:713 length:522 start_codon:yes stop_codon:yes gene_type:complete
MSVKKYPNFTLDKFKNFFKSSNLATLQGESGTGKTSASRKLASAHKHLISFIGQKNVIYDSSLESNINLNNKDDEDVTNYFIENLRLSHLKNTSKRLCDIASTGERQRIVLARSMMLKTKYIIIDEGLSGLQEEIISKIVKILKNNGKKNFLFITHQSYLISEIANNFDVKNI